MPTAEQAPPSLVAPEYGPTGPELLRQRLGPRRGRTALIAGGVVLVALIALIIATAGDGLTKLEHRSAPQFTMLYPPGEVDRAAPRAGEIVRLRAGARRLRMVVTVRRLTLPAYEGSVSGLLPIYTDRHAEALARELPGFRFERDGKARVNDAPGYQLRYRAGRTEAIDLLIVPEDGDREGVLLRYRQAGKARGEAQKELAKAARSAFRSFRFGLDRP